MVLAAPPGSPSGGLVLAKTLLSRVGPGSGMSTETLFVPPGYNSVAIEAIPESGGAPNASFTVQDSIQDGSGFSATVDTNGVISNAGLAVKRSVGGVRPYVKVSYVVTAGLWSVTLALIAQPGISTTQVPGNVNVTNFPATQAVTAADGGLGTIGANADASVVGDVAGTLSAKLRGLTRVLGAVWDQVNNRLTVGEPDGANVALGAQADAAVYGDVAGTASAKLRGLSSFLNAVINRTFGWLRTQPQPSTWNLTGTSAANTAQTVTQAAAGAGVRNYLSGLTVSWSGGAPAAAANIQIKDGATVIWDQYLGQAGGTQGSNDFEFTQPLQSSANAALSVTVAAGGAAVTTKITANGNTGP